MAAPVLPALVMASALPSRTSSAVTTIDESLRVRTAAGRVVHPDDLGGGHDLHPAAPRWGAGA